MILLAGTSCAAHRPVSSVTYSCRATAIASVLAKLSDITGKKLNADDEMKPEIVLLSVKDMPFTDLIANIAKSTSGAWSVSGDTYTLKPDRALWDKQEKSDLDRRAGEISKMLASRQAQLVELAKHKKSTDGEDSGSQGATSGGGGTPMSIDLDAAEGDPAGETAIVGLLELIDPVQLASIGAQQRQVFAVGNPTNMQTGLPDQAEQVMSQFVEAYDASIPTEETPPEMPESTGNPAIDKKIKQSLEAIQPKKIEGGLAKTLLVVNGGSVGGQLSVELKCFDRYGRVLASDSTVFSGDSNRPTPQPSPNPTPTDSSDPLPQFTWSEDSNRFMGLFYGPLSSRLELKKSLSKEVSSKICDLNREEPLSTFASDLLNYYGTAKNVQIVADIPDQFFPGSLRLLRSGRGQSITGITAIATVKDSTDLNLEEKDHVIIIRPAHPTDSRLMRVSRGDLSYLIQSVSTKGYADLEDLSGYAVNNPPLTSNLISTAYIRTFAPNAIRHLRQWLGYRFYGLLTKDQRDSIQRGGKLNYAALDNAQARVAEQLLFSPNIEIGGVEPTKEPDPFLNTPTNDPLQDLPTPETAATEPTEVMPNGLANGFVAENDIVETVVNVGGGTMPILDATTFAILKVGSFGEPANQDFTLAKQGRFGRQTNLELIFHIGPKSAAHCTLTDFFFDPDAPLTDLNDLPDDFRKREQFAEAAFKKINEQGAQDEKPSESP